MTGSPTLPRGPFRVDPADRREADRLVAAGLLRHLLRDVYLSADTPSGPGARQAALGLVLPAPLRRRGVVSDRAALWLWTGGVAPGLIDLVLVSGRGSHSAPGVVLHQRRIDPGDTLILPGLSLTRPARTAVDLFRTLPAEQAWAAADALRAAIGLTPDLIAECLDRLPRVRGVPAARDLLARWRPEPWPGAPPPSDQSVRLPVTR